MTLVAGTGHPSNPPGRHGHVLTGGAPSGSIHGGGRAGRRQKPSMGKFTWSRTSPITVWNGLETAQAAGSCAAHWKSGSWSGTTLRGRLSRPTTSARHNWAKTSRRLSAMGI